MSEFNYPPRQTCRLGAALETAEERVAEAEERVEELEAEREVWEEEHGDDSDDAPPVTDTALAEARSDAQDARSQHNALQWAVGEFGEQAEIVLEAFTTATRSRVVDTIQRTTMGQVGPSETSDWLLAAGVEDAPWLDGGEDLPTQHELLGALPPGLTEWIDRELTELNDLSEGN